MVAPTDEVAAEDPRERIGQPQEWLVMGAMVAPEQLCSDGSVTEAIEQGVVVLDVSVAARLDHQLVDPVVSEMRRLGGQ